MSGMSGMGDHPVRQAFASPFSWQAGHGWGTRLAVSLGMAGFLAFMGVLSFPLPWTPVPFSMMPLGLLVAGGYQRPQWAAFSVLLYLAAGAAGAPIYAEGESGWRHLAGATSGYLFGYVLLASCVAWYLGRPRRSLPVWAARSLLAALGTAMMAGVAAIAWMLHKGTDFGTLKGLDAWGIGSSALWVFTFLTAAALAVGAWSLQRRRGTTDRGLDLYIVMLGSLVLLHVCGVTVLWLVGGYPLMMAVVLGSVVFLPYDAVKAALGVLLTLPFVPEEVHDA